MRLHEAGLDPGRFRRGPLNALSDVVGVSVGHVTLSRGDATRTGVTAILPHEGNLFRERVRAGVAVANGFGKLVGYTQVRELGEIETPIILTNTLATFRAADALLTHVLRHPQNARVRSVNPVVGETNDGYLNDIRARIVTEDHVFEAISSAQQHDVGEGCVGAGTGTVCLGWKGGIGTASRRVEVEGTAGTVGALVQTNFGGQLRIGRAVSLQVTGGATPGGGDGSCMIVVATDLALDARQLNRVAKRATFALARAGSSYGHGSGDYAIAFSTARGSARSVKDEALNDVFEATLDAVEEAVVASLWMAVDTTGYAGHIARAIPHDRIRALVSG